MVTCIVYSWHLFTACAVFNAFIAEAFFERLCGNGRRRFSLFNIVKPKNYLKGINSGEFSTQNGQFSRENSFYDANTLPEMPIEEINDIITSVENTRMFYGHPNSQTLGRNRSNMKNWFKRYFSLSHLAKCIERLNHACHRGDGQQKRTVDTNNNNNNSNKAAADTQQLSYEIRCPICYDNLLDAETIVVTECGHLYCDVCAKGIYISEDSSRPCPYCRENQLGSSLRILNFPTDKDYCKLPKHMWLNYKKPIRDHPKLYDKNKTEDKKVNNRPQNDPNTQANNKREKRNYKLQCENKSCSIDFYSVSNDPITVLSCGHFLCKNCAQKLGNKMKCPLCKKVRRKLLQIYMPEMKLNNSDA